MIFEFWDFLKERKKFWLMPIVVMILAIAFLVLSSQAIVLPFVYTLF